MPYFENNYFFCRSLHHFFLIFYFAFHRTFRLRIGALLVSTLCRFIGMATVRAFRLPPERRLVEVTMFCVGFCRAVDFLRLALLAALNRVRVELRLCSEVSSLLRILSRSARIRWISIAMVCRSLCSFLCCCNMVSSTFFCWMTSRMRLCCSKPRDLFCFWLMQALTFANDLMAMPWPLSAFEELPPPLMRPADLRCGCLDTSFDGSGGATTGTGFGVPDVGSGPVGRGLRGARTAK